MIRIFKNFQRSFIFLSFFIFPRLSLTVIGRNMKMQSEQLWFFFQKTYNLKNKIRSLKMNFLWNSGKEHFEFIIQVNLII